MGGSRVVLDDVSFHYRTNEALRHISATLAGGIHAIIGPPGAGKSTLLALIAGLHTPSSGRILIDGVECSGAARTGLGVVMPGYRPSGSLRVLDVLMCAAWAGGVRQKLAQGRAAGVLERLRLTELAKRRVRQLSQVQRRLVGIGAAVAHDPDLLVLDGPTARLSAADRLAVRRGIRAISRGRTVILATANLDDVARLCTGVAVLGEGRLRYVGPPSAMVEIGLAAGGSEGSALELGEQIVLAGHLR